MASDKTVNRLTNNQSQNKISGSVLKLRFQKNSLEDVIAKFFAFVFKQFMFEVLFQSGCDRK